MKKIAVLFLITIINFNLLSVSLPYDKEIGMVVLPNSNPSTEFIAKAVSEKYTPSWLIDYVEEGAINLLDATLGNELKASLPFALPIFSINKNIVKAKDLKTNTVITFSLNEEGKITVISFL